MSNTLRLEILAALAVLVWIVWTWKPRGRRYPHLTSGGRR